MSKIPDSGCARHYGGCHCGAVSFAVDVSCNEELVVWKCNCTICVMKQNHHFIVPASRFYLVKPILDGHTATDVSAPNATDLLFDTKEKDPMPTSKEQRHDDTVERTSSARDSAAHKASFDVEHLSEGTAHTTDNRSSSTVGPSVPHSESQDSSTTTSMLSQMARQLVLLAESGSKSQDNQLQTFPLSLYTFGTHCAKHFFCKICGVTSFYVPRSNPDGFAVTLWCISDRERLGSIVFKSFDGQNWDQEYESSNIASLSEMN